VSAKGWSPDDRIRAQGVAKFEAIGCCFRNFSEHSMKGISLTRFIIQEQRRTPGASGNFTLLLNDIAGACKAISQEANRGALTGVLGAADSENVQGEVQKKLDLITNDILVNAL